MRRCQTNSVFILTLALFFSCLVFGVLGQEKTPVSIAPKEMDKYRLSIEDSVPVSTRLAYIDSFLKAARAIKHDSLIYRGLIRKTWILGKAKQYDSAIAYTHQLYDLAKQNKDTLYLINALTKFGRYYKNNNQLGEAFCYYNQAFTRSRINKDTLQAGGKLLQMSNIQVYLGDYSGAKTTAVDGVKYLGNTKDLRNLSGLYHSISVANREQKNYEEALKYNKRALSLGKDSTSIQVIGIKNILIFKNTKANILADQKKYSEALFILKELASNPIVEQNQKEYARVLANLGLIKWKANNKNKESEEILLEALKIREEIQDIRGLIASNTDLAKYCFDIDKVKALKYAIKAHEYAKKYNDLPSILEALGLIFELKDNVKVEAIDYHTTYTRLNEINQRNREIYAVTKYENAQLTQKNKVLQKERDTGAKWIKAIGVLLVLSLAGVGYYYYRQRLYKKRFLQVLHTAPVVAPAPVPNSKEKTTTIHQDIVDDLLQQLEHFEQQHGYLDPKTNAKDLAKSFGSNTSYLSSVINTYKQKSISQYINDLRIAYAIDKLQSDPTFRKYTVKAISKEVGFNSAEGFSKKFYKKTGIYPSYFIKRLEE